MKVGDLLSLKMKKTNPPQEPMIGIVIDVMYELMHMPHDKPHYAPQQVKVHWQKHNHDSPWMCPTKFHEVLSEGR